ncbi:hypothetical protein [Naasia sp. SYSU D00057]|uniref:hypothetical protein n=1 Tax=Naasia sp. SYSU D00057 TaxID=2817380 RepID=UPI001B303901|nr:hypothetical protein [Naasia sp. SYSU D00057]
MIQDLHLTQPVPAGVALSGGLGTSVLSPRFPGASAGRTSATRGGRAMRRSTYEVPRRERALAALGGCAAVVTIALQAVGLLVL